MKRSAMGDLRKDVPVIISEFKKEGYTFSKKIKSRKSRSTYLLFNKKYVDMYGDNDSIEIKIRISDHNVGEHYNSYSGQMESYKEPVTNIRIDHYLIDYSLENEIKKAIEECLEYCNDNAI